MVGKEKRCCAGSSDRVKSIVRHINKQNPYYSASTCVFHFNKPCLTLLNNKDCKRFHCLFVNQAVRWISYSITKSCDIPENFYDLMILHEILGERYVLRFAGHLREETGYTVGMFRQNVGLYPPSKIDRSKFAETVFTMIVFFIAVCHRLGGITPNAKYFSVLYTETHPVLCDIGSHNVENRERLADRSEHFNQKRWKKFLQRRTHRRVIQYLKIYFPKFFQKKKAGKICILNENDGLFPDETHQLVCKSEKKPLLEIIKEFKHLISDRRLSSGLLMDWIMSVEEVEEECYIDDEYIHEFYND